MLLHEGSTPQDALAVMRARYTAYALGLADYIITSTHLDNPQYLLDQVLWKQEILQFSHDTQFKKLDILDFQKVNSEKATITFIAHLFQNQRDIFLKEKSVFLKSKKKWLYFDLEFIS